MKGCKIIFGNHFFEEGAFRYVMVLILFLSMMGGSALAQSRKVPPAELMMKDTINLGDSAKKGLLNKLLQPIRFRANHLQRERENMVELIRKLTREGDLSIDTSTVTAIVDDLLLLTQNLASTTDTTVRLQNEIRQVILNLDTKAPKALVDSVQVQLGNVLQKLLNEAQTESVNSRKEILAKLSALKQIQWSCGSPDLPIFQMPKGDSLLLNFQVCLKAEMRVFGWHQASMNEDISFYNLNYLTDLMLYGFELGVTGKEGNPQALKSLLEGGILEKSQKSNKAVSLSVYSNSPSVISGFLSSSEAQALFFLRIKALLTTYKLKGVNIYFEGLQPKESKKFSAFMTQLQKELKSLDNAFLLTLNIPPIANSKDLALAGSIDFEALNSVVDYYLVQTQKLNVTNTRIPFSLSPLYPDQANSRGSIERTFATYTNGKIPVGKFVMTLSYQGISWPMPDFIPGSRAKDFGSVMDYSEIQQSIVSTISQPEGAIRGYDPEQASAYLNYGQLGDLHQVWFDDTQSLETKYTWALDNAIGGVAIWGLGYQKGDPELWDVLGATLLRVDTTVVSVDTLQNSGKLGLKDYLLTYLQDIQWAGLNDIYIGDPNKKPVPYYCWYKTYPDRDSLQSLAKARDIQSFWQHRNQFVPYDTTEYYSLNSFKDCVCMLGRWDRYSQINAWVSMGLFTLTVLFILIILIGIKKNGDDWGWRGLFTGISIGFGLLALIALFFYMFFDIGIGFIGAGSSEVTVWSLILIFGLGIAAGLAINRLRMVRKYAHRDLP